MMTTVEFAPLKSAITGSVFSPQRSGVRRRQVDLERQIDHRPAVIARCRSASDVSVALAFARAHSLEVSVRGGGHSYRGTSVCEGGVMIDLSAINVVSVAPPSAKRARVGGGATIADLDAATQEHGLAVTGGVISDTASVA